MSNELARQEQHPAVADTTAIIQVIERAAANPSVDIDKMERLLEMQERILRRNAETAFNAAMAQMQAELPSITEKGSIKHGDKLISTYARFEDINEAVRPILQKYGFAVSFKIDTADGKVKVTGILTHREGHRETTDMLLPADTGGAKNAVQALGSSVSYGKRYAMCALLNITTGGEDDDGKKSTGETITAKQVADLDALIEEVKANKTKFLQYLKLNRLEDMNVSAYNDAVAELRRKGKAHAAGK